MLQRIHDAAGKWVLGVILGLIALSFVFWGVDFNLTGVSTFAAKVNGEDIPLSEFERELQIQQNQYQQLYRIELDEDLRRELRRNVLEQMVSSAALEQRVAESGYRISDERLSEFVRSIPAFQVNGEFSMAVYRGTLANQGLTPSSFEVLQRQQLELGELRDGIVDSTFLTPVEFRRYLELSKQRREVAYAMFEVAALLDQVEVTEDAIKSHYEANPDRYMTVETVDIEYIELTRDDIAADIEVTDAALRDFYEDERDRFQTAEERRARHILIMGDDDEAARAEAEKAKERIDQGEDFAVVAKEVSDDPGTKEQGGDLGWIAPGMLAGPFEDALFDMDTGEVRGPVRTDFGYHVIRLDEVRAGEAQDFEEVKDRLREEYRERQAEDVFYRRANELADLSFEAFDELATVATDLGLPLKSRAGFPRSGDPELFPNGSAPVVQAAFSTEVLEDGANSDLVEVSDEHVLVLRVTGHHLPELQPLEAVHDQVEQELKRSLAEQQIDEAAAAFLAELQGRDAPESLDRAALAEAHGGAWHEPRWIERSDPDVPTEIAARAFALTKPAEGSTIRERVSLANGDQAVVVLSGLQPGAPESVARAERDQQLRELAQQAALAELQAYVGNVREGASVRIPEDVLEPRF